MKKVNRDKSLNLRVGIAILSTSLLASLSGCHISKENNPKTITKEQKERLIEHEGKMNRLGSLLDICEEVNDKGVSDDYKRADKYIYINYPTNDIKEKEEYQTIEEIRKRVAKFDKLSYQGKLDLIAYINKTVNNYDLDSAFEGLYREILATASGVDSTDLQNIENMSYLEEGKTMIELSDENPIELLGNYYGIGDDEASWLVRIIDLKPNKNDYYKIMENDKYFGPEDYSEAYVKKLNYTYEAYHKLLEHFEEKYDPNYFGYKGNKKVLKK